MTKRFEVNFPLANGRPEKRTAYIYLPESYFKEPSKRYPVLYMFDGHNVFFDSDATYGKSWGMKEYMDKTKTQMIIAAVNVITVQIMDAWRNILHLLSVILSLAMCLAEEKLPWTGL